MKINFSLPLSQIFFWKCAKEYSYFFHLFRNIIVLQFRTNEKIMPNWFVISNESLLWIMLIDTNGNGEVRGKLQLFFPVLSAVHCKCKCKCASLIDGTFSWFLRVNNTNMYVSKQIITLAKNQMRFWNVLLYIHQPTYLDKISLALVAFV